MPTLPATYQARVRDWILACFNDEILADGLERGDRLLEEVLELLQSKGYPEDRIPMLQRYVYDRAPGEPHQEVGGVMVTLAGFCACHGLDMHRDGEIELSRVWTKVEQIREKQRLKPKGSAIPVAVPVPVAATHTQACMFADTSIDPIAEMLRRAASLNDQGDKIGVDVNLHGARLAYAYKALTPTADTVKGARATQPSAAERLKASLSTPATVGGE